MDREKVIKALECCSQPAIRKCKECPYESYCYHDSLCDIAIHDALALLKEQQEQIEQMNFIYGFVYGGQVKEIKELVRCADCKFGEACKNGRGEHGVMCYNSHSASHSWVHEPEWFCADGERRQKNE